jgi:hypothetical protein
MIATNPIKTRVAAITSPYNDKRIVFMGADVNAVGGIEACVVNPEEVSISVTIGGNVAEDLGAENEFGSSI